MTLTTTTPTPEFSRARTGTLAVVMFCYLFYYTGRQTFGFAIPLISKELHLSLTELGFCSTIMLWCYALGQAINGQLADRFGGKRMMVAGAILSFGLCVTVSFAHGLAGLLIPWALNGLAQSMGWAPGAWILSNWWGREHRGRVFGWYTFAAGSSSVVAYGMSDFVAPHGWRWLFRLPVSLLLVGGIVFWLVVKERPSDAGFENLAEDTPDGVPNSSNLDDGQQLSATDRYARALKCLPFLIGCLSIGFQNLARYALLVWVPVHILGSPLESASSPWVALGLPIGMAVGAVSAGWLSDRVFKGRRSTAIILFLFAASAFSLAMYRLQPGSWWLLPLLFMTGFFVYGPQSGYWALCPELLGTRLAGTGTGIMNFFAYLFAGVGETLVGHLTDLTHSTSTVFLVVCVACAAGASLMIFVRR